MKYLNTYWKDITNKLFKHPYLDNKDSSLHIDNQKIKDEIDKNGYFKFYEETNATIYDFDDCKLTNRCIPSYIMDNNYLGRFRHYRGGRSAEHTSTGPSYSRVRWWDYHSYYIKNAHLCGIPILNNNFINTFSNGIKEVIDKSTNKFVPVDTIELENMKPRISRTYDISKPCNTFSKFAEHYNKEHDLGLKVVSNCNVPYSNLYDTSNRPYIRNDTLSVTFVKKAAMAKELDLGERKGSSCCHCIDYKT